MFGVKLRQVHAEQDPPVHSPAGEVHGLASRRMAPAWLGMDAGGCFWPAQLEVTLLPWRSGPESKGQVVLHIDPAVLAHSPDEVARPGTWVTRHADKSSRGSRIGCAKGHCTTPSIYPVLVLCAVKFVCNKYNPWSPGQMNCPLYCHGESFLVLHWLSTQTERSRGLCLL